MPRKTMPFAKDYIVIEELGSGAMATVSKAIQKSLDRPVAVKQMLPHLCADEEFVARFHREARAAAGLSHDNVVGIIDFGNEANNYFIVVEYIDGPTLKELVEAMDNKVPVPLVLSIAIQILNGLEHSHNQGVIHRDLKPANIMMTSSGVAKITDFGIAYASDLPSLTTTGQAMGTPSYMSPEQASGRKIDNRSDLFSVGVMLYELLTGNLPFKGKTVFNVLKQIADEPHPPIKSLNDTVPDALVDIVERALAKETTKRYFDATEFAYALENYCFDSSIRFGPRIVKASLDQYFKISGDDKKRFSTSQLLKTGQPTTDASKTPRPTVALLPLQGCFGCHVNLLDLHEDFERLNKKIDIKYTYLMDVKKIPKVDIGIVEGCVANDENEDRLIALAENCETLIALGTCACYGGVPGLRNLFDVKDIIDRAYVQSESTDDEGARPSPEHVPALSEHVRAVPDIVSNAHLIPGCPSPRPLIISAIESLLAGTEPKMPTHAVCHECRRTHKALLNPKREFIAPDVNSIMELDRIDQNRCFLEQGVLCMGMVTREGCNARCLESNYPCQGCMGPAPMVKESGAKWINTLGSLLPTGTLRFRDDIVGFGYRYTLPISIMPHKNP